MKEPIKQRTCVVCRNKTHLENLLRFVLVDSDIVYDMNKDIQSRGNYVCDKNECILKLDKWLEKKNKWKIKKLIDK